MTGAIEIVFHVLLLSFIALALYHSIKEDRALYAAIVSPLTLLQCARTYMEWAAL